MQSNELKNNVDLLKTVKGGQSSRDKKTRSGHTKKESQKKNNLPT